MDLPNEIKPEPHTSILKPILKFLEEEGNKVMDRGECKGLQIWAILIALKMTDRYLELTKEDGV